MLMPPPLLGSGKLVTPCARMQLANLSPASRTLGLTLPLFVTVPLGAPVDPHAARVRQQAMTLETPRTRRLRMATVVRGRS